MFGNLAVIYIQNFNTYQTRKPKFKIQFSENDIK